MTQERLSVLAGIDEAGLGPILGPLTLGYSAFRVPQATTNLWRELRSIVSDDPEQDRRKLIVADSKVVFTRTARGRARLERTALAFLAQRERSSPSSGAELVRCAPSGVRPGDRVFREHPWYERLRTELPFEIELAELESWSSKLSQGLEKRGVELAAAGVVVQPAGALNDSYRRTGNKSRTLWQMTEPILQELWDEFSQEDLHVTVDRHGGRLHYEDLLVQSFPMCFLARLREGRGGSEYELTGRGRDGSARRMRILFVEKADRTSFSVALASCFAKFARETCMDAFNEFFTELQPGLKPTAGYYNDGRRWIEEAEDALRLAGVDRDVLIRER